MSHAAQAGEAVDQLFFALNGRIGPRHRDRIGVIAEQIGVPSFGLLPAVGAELLAGPMPVSFVDDRLQYGPFDEMTHELLRDMSDRGFVEITEGYVTANPPLIPLLEALLDARDETAIWSLAGNDDLVERLNDACHALTVDASGTLLNYTRHVPEPDHPSARLLCRLMKVRYIRHECHMIAWRSAGFEPKQMPTFTKLWNGEPVDDDNAISSLVAAGLATDEPALTDHGQAVRDRIEDETNTCAQAAFDARLDRDAQATFIADLRSMQLAD